MAENVESMKSDKGCFWMVLAFVAALLLFIGWGFFSSYKQSLADQRRIEGIKAQQEIKIFPPRSDRQYGKFPPAIGTKYEITKGSAELLYSRLEVADASNPGNFKGSCYLNTNLAPDAYVTVVENFNTYTVLKLEGVPTDYKKSTNDCSLGDRFSMGVQYFR